MQPPSLFLGESFKARNKDWVHQEKHDIREMMRDEMQERMRDEWEKEFRTCYCYSKHQKILLHSSHH